MRVEVFATVTIDVDNDPVLTRFIGIVGIANERCWTSTNNPRWKFVFGDNVTEYILGS